MPNGRSPAAAEARLSDHKKESRVRLKWFAPGILSISLRLF
ncbi:hypothetical protein [Desulfosarcina ovata]|nr:hypothetical protein [Desulfosarcina ovata]